MKFEGVRIVGFDAYEVIVRRSDGFKYVIPFSSSGRIDNGKNYGKSIEEFAAETFAGWCEDRKISHSGTDMA